MTEPAADESTDDATDEAYTFVLDYFDRDVVPADLLERITDDRYVLAHLERPGPASVRAMLALALQRGHISPAAATNIDDAHDDAHDDGHDDGLEDVLPVASVVVMSAGCSGGEVWEVPTVDALAWWITAVDFRSVTRERYFAAFPRVDDGRDTDPEWLAISANLARHDGS